MSDLALAWPLADPSADLAIAGIDLEGDDDGLRTAVLVSLFSDARVEVAELPPGETSRAGWWGDLLETDGRGIGSKLWLIARAKETPETAARAAGYARAALEWMAEAGAIAGAEVSAGWIRAGWLALDVAVDLPASGRREWRFEWQAGA